MNPTPAPTAQEISIEDPRVSVSGRTAGAGTRMVGYPGVSFDIRFNAAVAGSSLAVRAASSSDKSRLGVVLDGTFFKSVLLPKGEWGALPLVPLLSDLGAGEHHVQLVHQNETWQGVVAISGFELPATSELLPSVSGSPGSSATKKRLLFIGDSVTCGEALLRAPGCTKNYEWWDPYNSYGLLVGRKLGADANLVCFGGRGLIRDWQGRRDGLNAHELFLNAVPLEAPATEVFAGCTLKPEQLLWDHQRFVPDVIVVSLGTNDFNLALGPLPTADEYVKAYVALVSELLQSAPNAQVVLTEGSIVSDRTDPKRPQKTTLRKYIQTTIERVGSKRVTFAPANYYPGDDCDPHPTTEQHAAMATDLLPYVQRALATPAK